jgi:two-component system cell cycle sensor histidine kinase/response regulator CckA
VVLVVDEPFSSQVAGWYLESAGFDCITALTGAAALALVSHGMLPAVMVLEVSLPDVPGPDLAMGVHEVHADIPVLFVSGSVEGVVDPDALSALHWEFLRKPYTHEALIQTVQRLARLDPASREEAAG